MKIKKFAILLAMIAFTYAANVQTVEASMKTQLDSISYALGQNYSNMIKHNNFEINLDMFFAGLKDGQTGNSKITREQEEALLGALNSMLQKKHTEELAKKSAANKEAGAKFLEENKKKENVKVTASGLQYQIVQEGTGKQPKATDKVTVHYTGKLLDGTVFDSSVQRGQPAVFGVTQVIKGWVEALQLMPVGSKWKLFVPSDMAYGEQGAGDLIQPNTTLIFEVELLGIQ